MKIACLLFDGITALDLFGPYEVLTKLPDAKICFTAKEKREYSDAYGLKIKAGNSLDEILQADVLLVPGGKGIAPLLTDKEIIEWVRRLDQRTKWTVSVCSGSLLLAQAGLLEGKRCTTHWNRKEELKKYNLDVVNERYIRDGKYITSAGVSAGIDMALYLTGLIAGEKTAIMIQKGIEYYPEPPFCDKKNVE